MDAPLAQRWSPGLFWRQCVVPARPDLGLRPPLSRLCMRRTSKSRDFAAMRRPLSRPGRCPCRSPRGAQAVRWRRSAVCALSLEWRL